MTVQKFGYVTDVGTVKVKKDKTVTYDRALELAEVFSLQGKVKDKRTAAVASAASRSWSRALICQRRPSRTARSRCRPSQAGPTT